jgi:ribA/ribD-fused uncharacterized protein
MNDITQFRGEFSWLSNFYPVDVILHPEDLDEPIIFPSVENAYQAGKCFNTKDMFNFVDITPAEAKKLNRLKKYKMIQFKNTTDFELFKLELMYNLLIQKYNKEPFKSLLIATGDSYIQEGNLWGDMFFGYCLKTNQGKNHLGHLIMKIRETLL